MGESKVGWLGKFVGDAESTDQFIKHPDHIELLAAGLLGEAGSVLAEVKKGVREGPAYPMPRAKVLEEIGDVLWYYIRLVSMMEPGLLRELESVNHRGPRPSQKNPLTQVLDFGTSVGALVAVVRRSGDPDPRNIREAFRDVWIELNHVSTATQIPLWEAALANEIKRANRWPTKPVPLPVFDDEYPEEEQLPRSLDIEFRERKGAGAPVVILRIKGLNIGDRLTDNIEAPDEYRYHDVFHFGHAAFLGWSPVVRAILRCKRKSRPSVDENEDGGRAQVVEEAISAMVFSRAKEMSFFQDVDHLEYDLLKNIQGLTRGYEVERVPLWQWEKAILRSYAAFRRLRENRGGRVHVDLIRRSIEYRSLQT